jgi:hypothetical protein
MESFRASAKYNDWHGTVAADNNANGIRQWLEQKEKIKPNEFLLAIKVRLTKHKYKSPAVLALVFEMETAEREFNSVQGTLKSMKGSIPVRKIEIALTPEEFFGLFKEFDVMLTRHGLSLEARKFNPVKKRVKRLRSS